ncbi:hypothetical protein AJ79_09229 [Helicocarpus griseus UAMH5409]|uniref:Uncharacterized protein n=1 Tax=Helicocarpus griseus UAMH5409 TaxID=1447875 RepID=A0A2B7WLF1_9EURO|nr:hypothetical protein AJ79_09229 [Helicocarpus griseus UAMH5409]
MSEQTNDQRACSIIIGYAREPSTIEQAEKAKEDLRGFMKSDETTGRLSNTEKQLFFAAANESAPPAVMVNSKTFDQLSSSARAAQSQRASNRRAREEREEREQAEMAANDRNRHG